MAEEINDMGRKNTLKDLQILNQKSKNNGYQIGHITLARLQVGHFIMMDVGSI